MCDALIVGTETLPPGAEVVPFQLGIALLLGTEVVSILDSVVIDSLGSGSVGNGSVPPRLILTDGIVKLTPGTVVLFRFGN